MFAAAGARPYGALIRNFGALVDGSAEIIENKKKQAMVPGGLLRVEMQKSAAFGSRFGIMFDTIWVTM